MPVTIVLPKLLWYQKPVQKALEDNTTKYITWVASRRIGKTLLAQCQAVRFCLSKKCNVGYVVPSGDLARKIIKQINEKWGASGCIVGSNSVDKFINFANGSTLYFHSAEAFSRGSGGYYAMIFDECAFLDETTYKTIFKPMELEAKKVLMCSTPCGVGGVFYDMYHKGKQGNKRYKSFECTLEESGLYDAETIKEIKENTPTAIFEQEYNCKFISGGISAFKGYEDLLRQYPAEHTKRLFGGIDFSGASGGSDSTVLTIVNERFEQVGVYSFPNGDTKTMEEIATILKNLNVTHAYAEENTIGAISIELIKKIYPKVTGFTTSNESKRNIVEWVINLCEKKQGAIIDHPEARLQFSNFIMDRTKGGKITYHNLKDSIHDDRVISHCLACWCCKSLSRAGAYCIA